MPDALLSIGMDVVTLIVAILGLLLGVTSFVWQAATYVMSGGRVRVEFLVGATRPGGASLTMKASRFDNDALRQAIDDGYGLPVMGVRVRNVGACR